jgi:hypothetical protein
MDTDTALLTPAMPEYGSASLSDVLPSALALLDVPQGRDILGLAGVLDGVRRIAVLLIDGLGYHLYPLAAKGSALFAAGVDGNLGTVRRLTTNFPSTTPTSLTSLGTGATPGEHGVLDFTVNIPGSDRVLTHILWPEDIDPLAWQPRPTCFELAAAAGVATTSVSRVYPHAGLANAAFRGSHRMGIMTAAETAEGMLAALTRGERSLVYGYFSTVDSMGHTFGTGSTQWYEAVTEVETLIDRVLTGLPGDAALLVTADHGMLTVDDADKLDLSDHPQLRQGVRLVAGEPRARYVHALPGAAEDVAAVWQETLGDRAAVWTRAEAIAAGWFGPVPEAHAARIGDVVVACRDRYTVVGAAESDGPTTGALRGYHGSMTEAEMAVPLWILRDLS